jgi:hypothetical protein
VSFTNLTFGDEYSFTIAPQSALGTGIAVTSGEVYEAADNSQLDATLMPLKHPFGKYSSAADIEKRGGFTFTYQAIEPGVLTVRWFRQIRKRHHSIVRIVASGKITVTAAGPARIRVRLTRYGKRLLKPGRTLRLTQSLGFEFPPAPELYGALAGPFYVRSKA